MNRNKELAQLLRDSSGNALILTALAATALIGAAGLATDTIQWTLWKRQLQREADSAAIAGATANYQGNSASSAATTEINRYSLLTLSGSPLIEVGPTSGPYTGKPNAVRVVLKASKTLPFSNLLLRSTPTFQAEATAAAINFGNYCVVSLESTTATGITFQGSSTVDLGCGMATNSQGSPAVSAGGSSSIIASPIAAVGAVPSSSNYASGTLLQPYSMAQADPYSSLPDPSVTNCSNQLNVQPNATVHVTNSGGVACYKGMDLKGNVTFDPGVYYIDGSSMNFGSQANVSGSGVVFILTSKTAASNPSSIASLNMNGGAKVNLTAPTSGTYDGILFYQDRRATMGNGNSSTNFVTGNSTSTLQGAVYIPSQAVQFTGTTGMDTNCLHLVARDVTFTGNSNISNTCPPGSDLPQITGTQIRLVN